MSRFYLPEKGDISVRTRTGKEIHAASPGSSVTYCGRWLRVSASFMKVYDDTSAVTCQKCLYTKQLTGSDD